jgi:hypothetical protein
MKIYWKNILTGVLFSLSLFVFSVISNLSFSYMGVSDAQITQMIIRNFKKFLILYNLKIFFFYIGLGLLIGLLAMLLGIKRKRGVLFFSVFFWGFFWLRAIKIFPQLFVSVLYNNGGVRRYFQIFVTDFLPLVVIYGLFVLIVAAIGVRKKRLIGAGLVLLVSFLLVVHIRVAPLKAQAATAPNVLIFATDSLRPQNVSHNGYYRQTPHIDEVLADGASFLNAKPCIALTFPSWTSVLTSLLPTDHGIRTMYPTQKELANSWLTLPEILNRHHYETFVVSDFAGDMFSRHDYGFQHIQAPGFTIYSILRQRCLEIHTFLFGILVNPVGQAFFPEISGLPTYLDPYYVQEKAKSYIRQSVREKKPFFGIAFFSNNHFPYVSPHPYYRFYAQKKYYGQHKYSLSSDMLRSFLGGSLPDYDQRQIVNLYDGATRLYDDNLGDMLTFLKESDLDRDTIIILMSDHGENLCEQNLGCGHSEHLRGPYGNTMFLGIHSPHESFQGRRIAPTVREIDIAPTILDLLHIPIPAAFKGQSLLPCMRGQPFAGRPVYMESGIWYTHGEPFIPNRLRRDYPIINEMLTLNMKTGEILLQETFTKQVIEAKHRGLQWNERKYIYMPGNDSVMDEYYLNEVLQKKEDLHDSQLLKFKEMLLDMFQGRFYLDAAGFIQEKALENGTASGYR